MSPYYAEQHRTRPVTEDEIARLREVEAAALTLLAEWDWRIHDHWAAPDEEKIEALRDALRGKGQAA